MDAYELTKRRMRETRGYACGKCHLVYNLNQQDLAESCCGPKECYRCNVAPRQGYGYHCATCSDIVAAEREAEREAARFAMARKISEAEHAKEYDSEWVFSETNGGANDGYFSSIEELRQHCEEEEEDLPAYVWPCKARELWIDADWLVQQACEDHHEDASAEISGQSVRKLQTFLDNWCAEQGVTSYEEDRTTVVMLDPSG